jgi:hypothetical protein
MSTVTCGTYSLDDARREHIAMREEIEAESAWLAALGAEQRARARARALRRVPSSLGEDVREVFKRAERRAQVDRRPVLHALRSSGARNRRAPSRTARASAPPSSPESSPEPAGSAEFTPDAFADLVEVFRVLHTWSLERAR